MDSAEPIESAEVGEVIGGYRLERLLGAGSVARVFLGEHVRLGRKVAIKVLSESLVDDERVIERFLNEARIVNDIRHPNIVDISDFIESQSPRRVALVMELIEGPSLKKVIREGRPLSFVQAAGVLLQLASACEAAHGAGIIHRDLKPDNLLLTSDPETDPDVIPTLKVVDFGIAKIGGPTGKTATGMMIGTPAYMAPEQIAGKPPPSPATDVYAVGEVLYEVLTGRRVFPPGAIAQMIQTKLKGELPVLETPPVPGGVAIVQLVTRCIAVRQQDRPRLSEVQDVLLQVCPEAEVVLSRPGRKRAASSEADTIEPPDAYVRRDPASAEPTDPPVDDLLGRAGIIAEPSIQPPVPAARAFDVATAESPLPPRGVASMRLVKEDAAPRDVATTASPLPAGGVVAAMRSIAQESPTVPVPVVEVPRDPINPALLTIPAEPSSPTLFAGDPEHRATAVILPASEEPPEGTVTPVLIREPWVAPTTVGSPFDDSTTVVKRMTEHARAIAHGAGRAPLAWAAGLAAVASIIVAVAATAGLEHRRDAVRGAEEEPEVVVVPHARVEAPRGRVQIGSTPEGARVEDARSGAVLGSTPLVLELGGAVPPPARVRLSAPGFEAIELDVPRGNANIAVELTRIAPARPARPARKDEPTETAQPTPAPEAKDFPTW